MRGVIKSFDASAYKATVQIAGSLSVWLGEVVVARNIPSSEMIEGRNCALIFFNPANPQDAVLIAVYT
jgi:hypothetical protein